VLLPSCLRVLRGFLVFVLFVRRRARAGGRFEAGAQVTFAHSGEFDGTDTGIGARLSWRVAEMVAADAEIDVFPGELRESHRRSAADAWRASSGRDRGAASRQRASVRESAAGFRQVRGAPVACIQIFPPPLTCLLAGGRTLFALDIGGGIDVFTADRSSSDSTPANRLLKYPGPSFRGGRPHGAGFVLRSRPSRLGWEPA
jgi:hypothetical protein